MAPDPGVHKHDHSGFAEFGCQACEFAAAEEFDAAEQEFLEASVAVWRAIDRAMAEQPHYQGIEVMEEGVALRKRERDAWDRYKAVLNAD